jgi:hypothetical protein
MAGTVVANILNTDTGVYSTNNAYNGIAKAWLNFQGANPAIIRGSYNVSSVTYNGAGDFTVNFATTLSSANYACVVTGSNGGSQGLIAGIRDASAVPTATSVDLFFVNSSFGSVNPTYGMVSVFSN